MIAARSTEFLPVTPLIAVHVLNGLVAVSAGLVAMRSTKGSVVHRRAGLAYLGALLIISATATSLVHEDFTQRWPLAALGLLAVLLAGIGYTARLRQTRGWKSWHIGGMAGSYMAMLSAFYVDNGPRLPLWRLLPSTLLLLLPWVVGIPITWRAVRHHRARNVKQTPR